MYPVENHIPGILYTYKKSFGFLIFRLTAAYKKKNDFISVTYTARTPVNTKPRGQAESGT
jgi:hypothetical protein